MQKTNNAQLIIVTGVISIIGLLFLFLIPEITGNTYAGPLENARLPYLEKRSFGGIDKTHEGVRVVNEQEAYNFGIPFRSYSRVEEKIPTLYTACGETYIDASLKIKKTVESLVPNEYCSYYPELQVYCCVIPLLKTKDYANYVPERTIH